MSLTPNVSNNKTPPNVAWQNSWILVNNDQGRPLFASAVYPVSVLGNNGFIAITNTATVTGNFIGLTTTSASTVSLSSSSGINSSVSLPTTFTLQTPFTGINVSSGSVLAFYA
jgi:hypothetical protein